MRLNLIPRLLLWWGGSILAILYLMLAISGCAEAFDKGGWGGLIVAIVFASAVPSMVLALIIQERADRKEIAKRWLER